MLPFELHCDLGLHTGIYYKSVRISFSSNPNSTSTSSGRSAKGIAFTIDITRLDMAPMVDIALFIASLDRSKDFRD